MTMPRKTRSAAAAIGATVAQIMAAIYSGKLTPPIKDSSGDYLWTDEDLDRARAALAVDRRRKQPEPSQLPKLPAKCSKVKAGAS